MGQFDKKLKNEPAAAKSQKLLKKKSSSKLDSLNHNHSSEKERNMKIFATMEKKKDLANSSNKATAAMSDTKVMKKIKKKDAMRRQKS